MADGVTNEDLFGAAEPPSITNEDIFGAAPAGTSPAPGSAPSPLATLTGMVLPVDAIDTTELSKGFFLEPATTDYPELDESLLLDRPYTEKTSAQNYWSDGDGKPAIRLTGEGAYKGLMYLASGEFLRGPPSRMTGVHRAQRIRDSSRGELPGDPMGETWTSGVWQGFLNSVAGAAGIVGSKVAFPIMLGVGIAREATEVLAHEVAKRQDWAQGSGESAQAIQRALNTGDLSYVAHQARFSRRLGAGIRMTLESMSIPIAAAVHAPEGEKLAAAVDAFYMYPVESLIGPGAVGKFATRFPRGSRVPVPARVKVGGKTVMEVVKDPSMESFKELVSPERKTLDIAGETIVHEQPPRQTIFGLRKNRSLEMAPWAHEIFYKTPDWLKPVIWDTFTPTDQAGMSRLRSFQKLSSTQHVRDGVDALFDGAKYTQFKSELKKKAEASGMGVLSDQQLDVLAFDSVQGILFKDIKSGKLTFPWEEANKKALEGVEQWDREMRSVVPETLSDYKALNNMALLLDGFGLSEDEVGLVMSYAMKMTTDLVEGSEPSILRGVPSELLRSVDGSPALVSELTDVGAAIAARASPQEPVPVSAPVERISRAEYDVANTRMRRHQAELREEFHRLSFDPSHPRRTEIREALDAYDRKGPYENPDFFGSPEAIAEAQKRKKEWAFRPPEDDTPWPEGYPNWEEGRLVEFEQEVAVGRFEETPVGVANMPRVELESVVREYANNAPGLAVWIAQVAERAALAAVATRISPFLEGISIHVMGEGDLAPSKIAYGLQKASMTTDFVTGEQKMWVRGAHYDQTGMSLETLVHELVHGATVRRLELGKLHANDGTPLGNAFDGLNGLVKTVWKAQQKAKAAGKPVGPRRLNPEELVAYGLTDANFQKLLSTIKIGKNQNAFGKFTSLIGELLGIKGKEVTALTEVIRLTDDLLSVRAKDVPQKKLTRAKGAKTFLHEADIPIGRAPEGTIARKNQGGKKARKEYIASTKRMRKKASPEQERHFLKMDKLLRKYGDGGKMFASPADLYRHFNRSLRNMMRSPGGKELTGGALKALAVKMGNDPAWIEYINTPKSANGLTWKPHETVLPGQTTVDGLSMEQAVQRAAPGLRMYVALREIEPLGRYGPRGFPVTKKGRLIADVKKNKYDKTIERIFRDFAGPEADRRAALVTALYNERPILRLRAQPNSPPLVSFLSEQMIDPESFLYELGTLFAAQQQELPRLLGVKPLQIMKTTNAYVTRSWNDMAERRIQIQQNLNNDIFGIPLHKTSPRHKRGLSDLETQHRYIEMMGEDPTGFTAEQVIKWSVDQTEMLVQNLHFFDDTLRWLGEQGIDTSKRRAGYEQVPTLLDVDPTKAASPDPYNWMFGKMAGKWVPADMARSLKMSRKSLERVPPIMSVWKLMHTAFNLPGYQVRNELGDLLNIATSSGFDPTSKVWRATRKEAYREMDNYYNKNAASVDIQNAVNRGVMTSKDVDSPAMVTGDAPIDTQAFAIGAEAMERQLASVGLDPSPDAVWKRVSVMNNLITFGEFAKGSWQKWGTTSVKGEKGIKIGTAWRNILDVYHETKGRTGSWRTAGSNMLLQANSELASGVISKWTQRQENRRRLFAYKIGRKLGLDEATAARWAQDTIHDYSDRPGWLRYTQTGNVLPYLSPPFSTYLYKQTMFGMRQALTKPSLFVSWMLLQGMNAYDEQYRADRDLMVPGANGNRMPDGTKTKSEQEYLMRYRSSMLGSYGANKMYLQNGNDVAEAIQDTVRFFGGAKGRELAKNSKYIKAIRGWDKNGNLHKLTYVLPLRDIGNLSSMLADFQPNEMSMRQAARMNPFVDLIIMATMNGPFGSRTLKSEATGEQVNPNEPGVGKYVSRVLQQLVHTFTPWLSWDRYGPASLVTGRTRDALMSASRGEVYTVGEKGYPIDPISAVSRTMTPGLSVSALDQLNMQTRVMNKFDFRAKEMARRTNEYKRSKLTGFGEEENELTTRSEAIIKIRTADTLLQMEYALGRTTRREAQRKRKGLRQLWKQLDAKFKKGENVVASEVGTVDSKIVTRALLGAVNSVYTGGKNDPITEEEFFGVGEIE